MLKWKKIKNKYVSGEYGSVGKLHLFDCWYAVILAKDYELPYKLTTSLPQMKTHRFETLEEGKECAEKMLKEFMSYLNKHIKGE